MTPLVYNLSVGAGLVMIGAGCWLAFGLPCALIVVGSLIIGLTLLLTVFGSGGR